MTHPQMIKLAVDWLRRYRCGVVLSEQLCQSGEMPDAIGWKRRCLLRQEGGGLQHRE